MLLNTHKKNYTRYYISRSKYYISTTYLCHFNHRKLKYAISTYLYLSYLTKTIINYNINIKRKKSRNQNLLAHLHYITKLSSYKNTQNL